MIFLPELAQFFCLGLPGYCLASHTSLLLHLCILKQGFASLPCGLVEGGQEAGGVVGEQVLAGVPQPRVLLDDETVFTLGRVPENNAW